MTLPLPELPGVRHAEHELPTGVRLHVAEAGDPAAPERFSRLMLVSIVHPWTSRATALLNAWRLVYQPLIAAPVVGPALVRDGTVVRRFLETAMPAADAEIFVGVLSEPERAHASSLLYRHFQLRELPALAAGRLAGARIELPVKLLFPRGDVAQAPAQLAGVERHAPRAEVEVVDGGHLLPDQQPELVADRARAWFA